MAFEGESVCPNGGIQVVKNEPNVLGARFFLFVEHFDAVDAHGKSGTASDFIQMTGHHPDALGLALFVSTGQNTVA